MKLRILLQLSLVIVSILGITLSLVFFFFQNTALPTQDADTKPVSPLIVNELNQSPENLVNDSSTGNVLGATFPKNLDNTTSTEPTQNIVSLIPVNSPTEQTGIRLDMRLAIPKINVNAVVESVGLTHDGSMDAPKGPTNVALFNRGPRPGEKGSAVITGHYGQWEDGKDSVFDDLHTLKKGDIIHVEHGDGTTVSFVVRELRTYAEYDDATEVFGSSDGEAHLNLITCAGTWDKPTNTYSHRLVVFTDKE